MPYVICRNVGCDFEIPLLDIEVENGEFIKEENLYCPKCGLPLAYKCEPPPSSGKESCGRSIDLPGQSHCMKCGQPLKFRPEPRR